MVMGIGVASSTSSDDVLAGGCEHRGVFYAYRNGKTSALWASVSTTQLPGILRMRSSTRKNLDGGQETPTTKIMELQVRLHAENRK